LLPVVLALRVFSGQYSRSAVGFPNWPSSFQGATAACPGTRGSDSRTWGEPATRDAGCIYGQCSCSECNLAKFGAGKRIRSALRCREQSFAGTNAGAVCFMLGTNVRSDLKVLRVDGKLPGQAGYPLK